jgi:hypothetical protein
MAVLVRMLAWAKVMLRFNIPCALLYVIIDINELLDAALRA